MAFETGKIYEFCDVSISVKIGEIFCMVIKPTNRSGLMSVFWEKEKYCASFDQIKQHILDAIEIAKISNYAISETLTVSIPFYPPLTLTLSEASKGIAILKKALDNYI
jgi:hypothetical protein